MIQDVTSGDQVSKRQQKLLASSGILSSFLYVFMNIICALLYDGYSTLNQTVSELSAIGAPTRKLWIFLSVIYALLVIAFGWGLRRARGKSRLLFSVGNLLIIYAFIGLFWPPMHQREAIAAGQGSMSDTLHIVFTMITVPLMILALGMGAFAFGKPFKIYSILTIFVQLFFGVLTGLAAPRLEANLPTPWIGVWERISIGAYLLWVVVLAVKVIRSGNNLLPQKTDS